MVWRPTEIWWNFRFDLKKKEKKREPIVTERGREFLMADPMYPKDISPRILLTILNRNTNELSIRGRAKRARRREGVEMKPL